MRLALPFSLYGEIFDISNFIHVRAIASYLRCNRNMETMSKELQNKSIPGRLELKETREDGKMHIKAYALA